MTTKTIIEKYPELFENCWEFDAPDTWLPSIEKLCAILRCRNKRLNTREKFAQIKVKFGYPRIYLDQYEETSYAWAKSCENHIHKLI